MIKPRKLVFLLCCAALSSVAINFFAFQPFAFRREAIAAQARTIQVAAASGPAGGMISVPIELVSQGDENAVGFSLTFDAAVLSNPTVVPGSGATGATLNSNASQAAQGRFGVALAFPANQKFAAGVRQMVVVTFSVAANAAFGTTNINFGDQPILREVADVTATALTTTYTGGAMTITKGFEADVSPRPDGDNNGTVAITDWVQLGRFVAGLDTAATGSEFQRADCAPRSALGDGRISIIDWTQAGRYAAALDTVTAAGGPTAASSSLAVAGVRSAVAGGQSAKRQSPTTIQARLQPATGYRLPATGYSLTIEIEANGNENALGFSLVFNASHWRLIGATAGRDAGEASLHINSTQAERGRIGFAIAMPVGRTIAQGDRQLVVCQFAPVARNKLMPLAFSFGDAPVRREIADVEANFVAADFSLESSALTNLSAASFSDEAFAPEQIVSAFGTNLATGVESAVTASLPETLAGTSVSVIDSAGVERNAPLFFVSPEQINYLIPSGTAEGSATVVVTNRDGVSPTGVIEIASVAPALFSANSDGTGLAAAVALRIKPDGARQFEPIAQFDEAQRRFVAIPLKFGDETEQVYLVLFGTGFRRASSVRAELGGQTIEIVFAGSQNEMAGLDQINLRLPASLRHQGKVELRLTVDGRQSNSVFLHVH